MEHAAVNFTGKKQRKCVSSDRPDVAKGLQVFLLLRKLALIPALCRAVARLKSRLRDEPRSSFLPVLNGIPAEKMCSIMWLE